MMVTVVLVAITTIPATPWIKKLTQSDSRNILEKNINTESHVLQEKTRLKVTENHWYVSTSEIRFQFNCKTHHSICLTLSCPVIL